MYESTEIVALTVFFEEPFWVGVFERVSGDKLYAGKVTFGAEPKDKEIYELILEKYNQLRFSPEVEVRIKQPGTNPKRIQRQVQKQLLNVGVGTKSQQALKLQQEQLKANRKSVSRQQLEDEKKWQFELKQQKKKEKHRGR